MSWNHAYDLELRLVRWPLSAADTRLLEELLGEHGLRVDPAGADYTIFAESSGKALGTISVASGVLKMAAVRPSAQGEGILAAMVTKVVQEEQKANRGHLFVFTPPRNVELFTPLGFRELASYGQEAALLERGKPDIDDYLSSLPPPLDDGVRGAVVVNCNPFTRGHLYLLETAAARVDELIVFVLEEDRSLFPAAVRLELVRRGTGHIPNVKVLPSGPYIISSATFPAYFLRDAELARVQAGLDATVFARHIAARCGIRHRFVGEEPYCASTRTYNEAMREVFSRFGIELHVVPRKEYEKGEAISASRVREAIREDDWESLERLVPPTTLEYLRSERARPVIEKIKSSPRRAH